MTIAAPAQRRRPLRRRPRAHWVLLAASLVTLLGALLLQGYTDHELGGTSTQSSGGGAAASVPGGGAIAYVDAGGALTSRPLPPRTVALTFDDGPDATWTPQVLDVLRREGIPATFFVVGSRAAAQPGLVRRVLREGSEIGLHTWTHEDLGHLPAWRQNLELSLNQLGLAGGAGVEAALLRLPYSSTPGGVDQRQLAALRRATSAGYVVALADRDSEDWQRPGVPAVIEGASPPDATVAGQVVLFHDAGGDRAETVAALPEVIRRYRARGYRFTTVTGALGLPAGAGDRPVGTLRHLQGQGLLAAVTIARAVARVATWLLLPLGLLAVLRTLLLLGLARRHVRVAAGRAAGAGWEPSVTVLIPAFDEEVGIAATLLSIARSQTHGLRDLQIVVIDDGSTDRTAEVVERLIDSHGLVGVQLVRQVNAGKAAALNRGLREARGDVVVMVDGDTVFEPDTVRTLVHPLADARVGAVSGNTKVGNRGGVLGKWQHLEYVIGFNLDRRMYDLLHCMPTVPGAAGAFRRSVLEQVGGIGTDTLAEDTDLTMAVSRAGWHVVYEERARAWTEAPQSLSALWRQRYRWCYGTLQAVWKHRRAATSRGPGRALGLIGLPYLLAFQVALPLLAPLVDLYAVYGLLFLDPTRVAAYWLGFLALQVLSGAYALRLDRERLAPLWALPLQQFGYRQLMYLVVIQSVLSAITGIRLPWQKLERSGGVVVGEAPVGEARVGAAV